MCDSCSPCPYDNPDCPAPGQPMGDGFHQSCYLAQRDRDNRELAAEAARPRLVKRGNKYELMVPANSDYHVEVVRSGSEPRDFRAPLYKRGEPDCLSCAEGMSRDECPESKRPCGHHCDCSWDQDECCWCGATFGEVGDPDYGVPKPRP